jgi:hypothetical protein
MLSKRITRQIWFCLQLQVGLIELSHDVKRAEFRFDQQGYVAEGSIT